MALPSFASVDDYIERFGAVDDETRAEMALSDASTDIRACVGLTMVDDDEDLDFTDAQAWAEDLFRKTCCQVAYRRLANPAGITQTADTIDGYSHSVGYSNESSDSYLKESEKTALRAAVGGSALSVWTLGTTRSGDTYRPDVRSLDDDGAIVKYADQQIASTAGYIDFTYDPLDP